MSSWDWLRQGGPVSDAVGGGIDFFTGGLTDFDGRGKGDSNLFNPIGGGSDQKWGGSSSSSSDGFSLDDAIQSFTQGYGSKIGPSASTPSGSSFLNAYTSGKSTTPTTTSPVSTSNVFTGGGGSQSMPGVVINQPVDFYALKDNQMPAGAFMGPGGSTAKGPSTGDKIKSGIVDVGKAFLTKTILGLCDIRTKTDISPLEMTEVNDDLAQVAFFVKELRECS